MPGVDQVRDPDQHQHARARCDCRAIWWSIGGSYIGLEFAQIYRRFGAQVTVVEMAAAPDPARGPGRFGRRSRRSSKARASRCRLDAKCIRFEPRGEDIRVGVDCSAGEPRVHRIARAAGRRPPSRTPTILAWTPPASSSTSAATSSSTMPCRPTRRGVWALGDCNGRGAFTHTAYNDFEIVAANLLDGETRRVSDRITAYALFTDPPLGRVGMSEAEARATRQAAPDRAPPDDARSAAPSRRARRWAL